MGDHDRAQEKLSRGRRSTDRHGTVGATICAVETALAPWSKNVDAPVFQHPSSTIGNHTPQLGVAFRYHVTRGLVQLGQIDRAVTWMGEIDLEVRWGRLHTGPSTSSGAFAICR